MKLNNLSIYERTLLLVKDPKKYFTIVSKESLGTVFNRMSPLIIAILVIQLIVDRFSVLNQLAEVTKPALGLTILFALLGLVATYIALPAVYNIVLRLFKSKKSFSDTLKVFLALAYFGIISLSAYIVFQLLFFLSMNSEVGLLIFLLVWALSALALGIYSFYLLLKGISVVHKVSMGKSFVALLLSGVIFFILIIIVSVIITLVSI